MNIGQSKNVQIAACGNLCDYKSNDIGSNVKNA
jgi:hypothetical protein